MGVTVAAVPQSFLAKRRAPVRGKWGSFGVVGGWIAFNLI